jgi:hypothetical protein
MPEYKPGHIIEAVLWGKAINERQDGGMTVQVGEFGFWGGHDAWFEP